MYSSPCPDSMERQVPSEQGDRRKEKSRLTEQVIKAKGHSGQAGVTQAGHHSSFNIYTKILPLAPAPKNPPATIEEIYLKMSLNSPNCTATD